VARGGWGPARIFSDLFNDARVASMKIEFYTDISETAKAPKVMQPVSTAVAEKSLLVVDDVADSGLSLQVAVEHLKARGAKEVRTTTLYYKPWSIFTPDYYARETRAWLVFAHEMAEFMRLRMKARETEGTSPETMRNEFIQLGIPKFLVDLIAMETAENELRPKL
jgi:hypoxanthine phosphoribosyltransferase